MKENLTTDMHAEFTINAQTAIKHKALCVLQLLGSDDTQEELEKYCSLYAISPEQALQWKDH